MAEAAAKKPLMNVLWEAQEEHGYLSEHVLKQISIEQDVPISRIYGVVKFYSMFRTEPQGKHVIEICGSPSCVLNDGVAIEKFLEKELGVRIGGTTKDGKFSLYKTSCIGCCDEAPAMLVDGQPHTKLTAERLRQCLRKFGGKATARCLSAPKKKTKSKSSGKKKSSSKKRSRR